MLARMRAGYFQPDLPRVVRLFDLAAQIEREQDDPPEVTISASSSDHSDDSRMASTGEELDADHRLRRVNPMDIDVDMCVWCIASLRFSTSGSLRQSLTFWVVVE